MNILKKSFLLLLMVCLQLGAYAQAKDERGRERLLMDFNWRFSFGHPYQTAKDFDTGTGYFSYLAKAGYGDGAAAADFDDRSWRKLNLPHDWAVEQDFSEKASFSHGFKAIGRNFPEATVGWYRKTFNIPASDLGRKIAIEFDGVFRNSAVWINGHYLGTEASGYNSFRYDLTDYLNYGGSNVIAVRADVTMEEGWFYEGAGIYRHVWLSKHEPLHVAPDGTFVTTQVSGSTAKVNARATVINGSTSGKTFTLVQAITAPNGKVVASGRIEKLWLAAFQEREVDLQLSVEQPQLWNIETPHLYQLHTSIFEGAKEADLYITTFGIRTIRFDAKEGFFLNGKHVKLKGTNNHQDHAGVGTAMPDELQYYRIRKLKEMGSNAYRCSHHPPTPELLEACDKLGMLVINENRLMGTNAQMHGDMRRMIQRDRNHPSIIAWSIGNEEWGIENSETGARIATTMQAYARSLDSTRAITVGVSGGFQSGISDVIEVMGYNYMGNGDIDAHQKRFPNQPGMGTEEGSTFATRGIYIDNPQRQHAAAYDKKPRPSFYSIEEGWQFYASRPYLAGMFIWTGFDYRGEPTPYGWPSVTSYFGMMDLCGFPKDNVYYLRSWWQDKPVLHILPHWNWKGREGEAIDVRVYSNCDEVELFLNRKSLGRQFMKPNSHLQWKVPYAAGKLEAIAYRGGKKILTDQRTTSGEATQISLSAHKGTLLANSEDIAMITVSVADKNNQTVPIAENGISFSISGPGKIIGVGNGDPSSLERENFVDQIRNIRASLRVEKALPENYDAVQALRLQPDSTWKEAFSTRDYKNLAKAYIHRGTFELPGDFSGAELTFFYKSIGTGQQIFINGKQIAKNIEDHQAGHVFRLNKDLLKPGANELTIIAAPLTKKRDWDKVNTDPGTIQILKPAAKWNRNVFSGLAQVIVQSSGEAGTIRLKASGPGLKPSTIVLQARPGGKRPALE